MYPIPAGFDFFDYLVRFPYRHTSLFFSYRDYPWYYPAPAIFVLWPFYKVCERVTALYAYHRFVCVGAALYLLGVSFVAVVALRRGARTSSLALLGFAAMLSTWPIYFALQRGNIEGLTWFLIALGMVAYAMGNRLLAATLIGVAGAIKIYPLIFAAIFVSKRQWRNLSFCLLVFGGITVCGLLYLEPGIRHAYKDVSAGVQQWTIDYSLVQRGEAYDHSIFGIYKSFVGSGGVTMAILVLYYRIAGLTALAIYFIRAVRLSTLNQVIFLSVAAITLPPTSFDYTLCLLYVPIGWMLIRTYSETGKNHRNLVILLVLGGLSIAPTLAVWSPVATSLPGNLRCVLLLLFALGALVFNLEERTPITFQAISSG